MGHREFAGDPMEPMERSVQEGPRPHGTQSRERVAAKVRNKWKLISGRSPRMMPTGRLDSMERAWSMPCPRRKRVRKLPATRRNCFRLKFDEGKRDTSVAKAAATVLEGAKRRRSAFLA